MWKLHFRNRCILTHFTISLPFQRTQSCSVSFLQKRLLEKMAASICMCDVPFESVTVWRQTHVCFALTVPSSTSNVRKTAIWQYLHACVFQTDARDYQVQVIQTFLKQASSSILRLLGCYSKWKAWVNTQHTPSDSSLEITYCNNFLSSHISTTLFVFVFSHAFISWTE